MKTLSFVLVALCATSVLAQGTAPGGAPPASEAKAPSLEPGDFAPEFALAGSDGKTYRLSDFKGKRAVVVAWFPKAFTGG